MPIPDYQQIMLPLLICIKDGQVHDMREVIEQTGGHFGLNDVDRTHRLPSGKQFTFDNRVGWARTYLKKAGLVRSPSRGRVQITARGKEILAANPEKIDAAFLEQFPEYLEFKYTQKVKPSEPPTQLSPEESLEVSGSGSPNSVGPRYS